MSSCLTRQPTLPRMVDPPIANDGTTFGPILVPPGSDVDHPVCYAEL